MKNVTKVTIGYNQNTLQMYSKFRSREEFLASDSIRKEVTYKVYSADSECLVGAKVCPCLAVCRSLADVDSFLDRYFDASGFSFPVRVRLCFNDLPVRGRCYLYPYGYNVSGFGRAPRSLPELSRSFAPDFVEVAPTGELF